MANFREPSIDKNTEKTEKSLLLKDFLSYLNNPFYQENTLDLGFLQKLWNVYRLWSLNWILIIPLIALIFFLSSRFAYDVPGNNSVSELAVSQSPWLLVFLALAWAPLIEEASFRLALYYSPWRFALSLSILLFVLVDGLFLKIPFLSQMFGLWMDNYFGFAALFVLFFLILFRLAALCLPDSFWPAFYKKNISWLIYGSSLLFGLLHLLNYKDLASIWHWSFLLVLPQALIGLTFAYIRIKYGFFWAVFGHFLHNAVLTLPTVAFLSLSSQTLALLQSESDISENSLPASDWLVIMLVFLFLLAIFLLSLWALFSMFFKKKDFS